MSFLSLGLENSVSQNIRSSFKNFRFPKYNKKLFLRKYKKVFNLGAKKFYFLKYKKNLFFRKCKKFVKSGFFYFLNLVLKVAQVALKSTTVFGSLEYLFFSRFLLIMLHKLNQIIINPKKFQAMFTSEKKTTQK